jgi:hypothetical protein
LPDNYKNKPNMKNLALSLVAIAALSLTSCVKTRTCTCVDYEKGVQTSSIDIPVKSTKSASKAACEASNYNDGVDERKCALK